MLDPKIHFLNHGSYGSVPRVIHDERIQWLEFIAEEPVQWLSDQLFPFLKDAIRDLSEYINADPEDVVFIDNATSGCNTVLKELHFTPEDNIVYFSTGYGAVNNAVEYVSNRYGTQVKILEIEFPIDMEKILEDFEAIIDEKTKLCVLDHINSSAAIVFPIRRFVEIAHGKNTMVLVDGAHAVGQIPLDMKAIDADFYTSNAHKWLCSVRSSAFIYIKKKHQDQMNPLVISHGYPWGFHSKFIYKGTGDYTPYLSIKSALWFRKLYGDEEWMEYTHKLARDAFTLLSEMWGTSGVFNEPNDEYIGQFIAIYLPNSMVELPGKEWETAQYIQRKLFDEHQIECPINFMGGDTYLVRISAQVYNTLDEYEVLGKAIKEIFGL